MADRLTSLQSEAKRHVDALVAACGISLHWMHEPGPLYAAERMLVGRGEALTVWLYDDGIDCRLRDSEVVNFEALNFPNESALLSAALEFLAQSIPPRAPRNA